MDRPKQFVISSEFFKANNPDPGTPLYEEGTFTAVARPLNDETAPDSRSCSSVPTNKSGIFKESLYGWCVVASVFMIHVIVDGMTNSFGSLYKIFLEEYHGGPVTTSILMSLLVGVTYGCGPLASTLCDRFGARVVAVLGSVLACTGIALTILSKTIWQVALTYGALTGLGFGFMYLPAIVTVTSWFDKRRALAVAIAVSGSGVGTFMFNPFITFLVEKVGLQKCYAVLAGIAMTGAFFGALLKPSPNQSCEPVKEKAQETTYVPEKPKNTDEIVPRLKAWMKQAVDWKLFKSWSFLTYCVASFLGGIAAYVPYMYLADRAKEESGVHESDASWLMSIVGITNIVGRVIAGLLADRKVINSAVLYAVSCIVCGVATSLSIYCDVYEAYAAYAVVFGLTGGVIVALQSLVLTDIVGVERISNAFGILLFFQGIAVFIGPVIAGVLIAETSGLYRLCFIVFGVIMCISGSLLLLLPIVKRLRSRGEKFICPKKSPLDGTFYVKNVTDL